MMSSPRRLEDADDFVATWMSDYSIIYQNCFQTNDWLTFSLCPGDSSCKTGCSGGADYLVDIHVFLEAYLQAKVDSKAYACMAAQEKCGQAGTDDDAACYEAAGLEGCNDNDEGGNNNNNAFDIEEFTSCRAFDDNYWVGPYCAQDNYNIYLGVFSDYNCAYMVDPSVLSNAYDGYVLPYTNSSIITSGECATCEDEYKALRNYYNDDDGNNNNDDGNNNGNVLDQCEYLYTNTGKCESNLEVNNWNGDGSSCSYIEQLQADESVTIGGPRKKNIVTTTSEEVIENAAVYVDKVKEAISAASLEEMAIALGVAVAMILVICCCCYCYCCRGGRSKSVATAAGGGGSRGGRTRREPQEEDWYLRDGRERLV